MTDKNVGFPNKDEVYARYEQSKSNMELWRGRLSEIYKYFFPPKDKFYDRTEGQSVTNPIWDSTGQLSATNFANFLQQTLMPPYERWIELSIGSAFTSNDNFSKQEKEDINKKLQNDTELLFEYLDQSNFVLAVSESFQDLVCGTGVILVQEGTLSRPLDFTSVPIANLVVSNNAGDYIQDYWRRWEIKPSEIKDKWPLSEISIDSKTSKESKIFMVEGCIYFPENEDNKKYFYYLQLEEEKTLILKKWYSYSPFVGFRYSKISGETLGRGLAEIALPYVKVLNKMVEYELQGAKFRAYPAYIDMSGRSLNPYTTKILPGSLTPIRWNGVGDPIRPIPPGGDPNFAQLSIQNLRRMINEILYSDPLGNIEQTPNKTATEISIRQQNFLKRSGNASARLARECILPLVENAIIILRNKGILKNIETSQGDFEYSVSKNHIKIEYKAPLMSLQNKNDLQRLLQWSEIVAQLESIKQIGWMMNVEQIPLYVAEKLDVNLNLIKNETEVKNAITSTQNASAKIAQHQGQPVELGQVMQNLQSGGEPNRMSSEGAAQ